MGDRRERKSLWDVNDESGHSSWTGKERKYSHASRNHQEFSSSRSYGATKSRDHTGQPYWEPVVEETGPPNNNTFFRKETGSGSRYFQNMSPGLDGMNRHKYDHSHENSGSNSRRHVERSRSRSRSRSRTGGRSRSRSLSRDRIRERSRSRSRGDGNARAVLRSRSPTGDTWKHYSWSDRRNVPSKPSQVCRDFAIGRCKKGSQCRFPHSSNSHGNGDPLQSDTGKVDGGHISESSYSKVPGPDIESDFSDPYQGGNERVQNRGSHAIPCREFVKGKCRWGDSCRFSHHFASEEDFGKGPRHARSETEIQLQPYKDRKPFCKFFAVRKCSRDDCRFSHEDPRAGNLDSRIVAASDERRNSDSQSGHGWEEWKNDSMNWKEQPAPLVGVDMDSRMVAAIDERRNNVSQSGHGWDEWKNDSMNWKERAASLVGVDMDSRMVAASDERRNNDSQSGRGWDEWKNDSMNWKERPAPLVGVDSSSERTCPVVHDDSIANKGETHTLQFQLPSKEENREGVVQDTLQGAQIQQHDHRAAENASMSSYQLDPSDGVKEFKNSTHSAIFSVENRDQEDEKMLPQNSSISNDLDRNQSLHSASPINGFSINLNGSETHLVQSLLSQMQNKVKGAQMAEMLAGKVPQLFPNMVTTEMASVANPQVLPVQNVAKNNSYQELSGVDASQIFSMLPSVANSSNLQLTPLMESYNAFENGNSSQNRQENPEQNNQMHELQSYSLHNAGTGPDSVKIDIVASPKVKLEIEIGKSDHYEVHRTDPEEKDEIPENKLAEAVDGVGKAEESSTNKDDKSMRIFKNSLIDLVKDLLKPTWKEGRMSREVHKTVVKKVVDKIMSTIQIDHIPKTQDKIDHYLKYSKTKISKLVQAYVGRNLKKES